MAVVAPDRRPGTVSAYRRAEHAAEGDLTPLRRARIDRGMSTREVAAAAGLHVNTVQRVERETDASKVHRLTWARLSRAFGVPREQLVPL